MTLPDLPRLREAVELLTSKGEFLNRISRHNAYEFAVAVADVSAAARLVLAGRSGPYCVIHYATAAGPDELRCLMAPRGLGLPPACRIVSALILIDPE